MVSGSFYSAEMAVDTITQTLLLGPFGGLSVDWVHARNDRSARLGVDQKAYDCNEKRDYQDANNRCRFVLRVLPAGFCVLSSNWRLLGGAEGQEVLGAFDGILEAAEELLKVGAALDEVDLRGVDD
jgi:hypothetical protein